ALSGKVRRTAAVRSLTRTLLAAWRIERSNSYVCHNNSSPTSTARGKRVRWGFVQQLQLQVELSKSDVKGLSTTWVWVVQSDCPMSARLKVTQKRATQSSN